MNIFGYILILITLIFTVLIGIKQPQMHNRLMMFDSQYIIVNENKTEPTQKVIENKNWPTVSVETTKKEEPVKVAPKEVKKVETPKVVVKTDTKKEPIEKPTVKTTTKPATVTTTKTQVPVTKPIEPVNTPVQPAVKVLTEQEELIAWNKWRSDLQNQILKDIKLPIIPKGTVFKMQFDVDRNGKITNIQTWSTDSKYTPYAIEFIAPVIRSYQGKSILDFPKGSRRTSTTFEGRFKISNSSNFSNPNDYNDIEVVK